MSNQPPIVSVSACSKRVHAPIRVIALFKGIITPVLFLVAMPLQHAFDNPVPIPSTGMAHGIACLLSLAMMVATFARSRVPPSGWLRTTFASPVPFGTFLEDPYFRRIEHARQGRHMDEKGAVGRGHGIPIES